VKPVAPRAPKRVQMSRKNPWRADNPDAVRVDRLTRWGNPFRIGGEQLVERYYPSFGRTHVTAHDRREAAAWFSLVLGRDWGLPSLPFAMPDVRRELAGRDLACWCPLDSPCHADVLLELANGADA
jgi:hypothetical protein